MKSRPSFAFCLFLFAAIALGSRFAWVVGNSRSGSTSILSNWGTATSNLVGGETISLGDRTPREQAEFWLKKVSHVDATNSDATNSDAQIALGAAWVLDAPHPGFIKYHLSKNDLGVPGIPTTLKPNYESIHREVDAFESLCKEACLAKMKIATQLDPNNLETWRTRGQLLFSTSIFGFGSKPRQENWLTVLDQCAKHDPDNALYDYLAAEYLWSISADYDYDKDDNWKVVLTIKDRANYERANKRFQAGQAKRFLKFGTTCYPSTIAFLEKAAITKTLLVETAENRNFGNREYALLATIRRWQDVLQEDAVNKGEIETATTHVKSVIHMLDQLPAKDDSDSSSLISWSLRAWGYAVLKKLYEKHPHITTADEIKKNASLYDQLRLDLRIQSESVRRFHKKNETKKTLSSYGLHCYQPTHSHWSS